MRGCCEDGAGRGGGMGGGRGMVIPFVDQGESIGN